MSHSCGEKEYKYKQLYVLFSSTKMTSRKYSYEFFYCLLFCAFLLEIQMLAIQKQDWQNESTQVKYVHFPLWLT